MKKALVVRFAYCYRKKNKMKPTVLYIEDDEMNVFVLKALLKNDFHVKVIQRPLEALAHLEQQHYRAVIIDVHLGRGEMTGIELQQKIRNLEHPPECLIVVTAYAMPGDREKLLKAGFNYYFSKPINRSEILEVLSNIYVENPKNI